MHKDEPEMFLKFATSMKLFMGSSVTREILTRALDLLYKYLANFKKVYSATSHPSDAYIDVTV